MPLFTAANFAVFKEPCSADPAFDVERARVREKLTWLHQQIYPQLRVRRFDLHSHWMMERLTTPYLILPGSRRIDSMSLRYSKAETVMHLMKKTLGSAVGNWDDNAMLLLRVDSAGANVEFCIPVGASADGRNFAYKFSHAAPEKKHLRQLFAALGRDYVLTLFEVQLQGDGSAVRDELTQARTSRLTNLPILEAIVGRYMPGRHEFRIGITLSGDDLRMEKEKIADELLLRIGELYPFYHYAVWSPRNDFLLRALDKSSESDL